MIRSPEPTVATIEVLESTPEERAASLAQRERYLNNLRWYSEHIEEIAASHRGKYICVAGQELFTGTDFGQVLAAARAKHPDDIGAMFSKHVSTHTGPKVYAN